MPTKTRGSRTRNHHASRKNPKLQGVSSELSLYHEREDNLIKTLKENFPADIKDASTIRRRRVNVTLAPEKLLHVGLFIRHQLTLHNPTCVAAGGYTTSPHKASVYLRSY